MNYVLALAVVLTVLLVVGLTQMSRAQPIVYQKFTAPPLDIPRLIAAIKEVENWDGHTRGRMGEWGPMQMRPAIWKVYANDEAGYIAKLMGEATSLGRRPTPWLIGLLHNAGYPAVASQRAMALKLDFASRVENVYLAR